MNSTTEDLPFQSLRGVDSSSRREEEDDKVPVLFPPPPLQLTDQEDVALALHFGDVGGDASISKEDKICKVWAGASKCQNCKLAGLTHGGREGGNKFGGCSETNLGL